MTNVIIIEITQTILILGSLVLILWQVRSDHNRRRKDATVNFMKDVIFNFRPIDYELSGGVDLKITRGKLEKILSDQSKRDEAMNLCARMEHLSAAVNFDVFDKNLINKMDGVYLITFYHRWFNFFQYRIYLPHTSITAYDQIEILTKDLVKVRNQANDLAKGEKPLLTPRSLNREKGIWTPKEAIDRITDTEEHLGIGRE